MIPVDFIRQIGYGKLSNFNANVTDVVIDSRKVIPGSMFIALQGSKTDGHQYVQAAVDRKAALCVVSKTWASQKKTDQLPLWIVESPIKALQRLAKKWRAQFDMPVLAISGTSGKTSTRAMAAAILGTQYSIHSTQGNLNNQLGLPLTLLKMTEEHDFGILELGTNHFGEIAFLTKLSHPTAALITNIGYGHTEFFGDIKGVAKAKAELFESIHPSDTCFINMNDSHIRSIIPNTKLIRYGMDTPGTDVNGTIKEYDDNACATLIINRFLSIKLKTPGAAMAQNALAAAAVGLKYSVPVDQIKAVLESFESVNQRFAVTQTPNCRIINDAYNANPDSTRAALQTFSKMRVPGRRLFVFADMLELGKAAADYHHEIGKLINNSPVDCALTYGPLSHHTHTTVQKAGKIEAQHFDSKTQLITALKKSIKPSDTILFKGSRGNRLEEIIEGINS